MMQATPKRLSFIAARSHPLAGCSAFGRPGATPSCEGPGPRPAGRYALAFIFATLLAACDTGPSEAEFLAVCLNEGQTAVNQAISKRMGIDRDAYCKCTAKQARTAVSADGYRWMMLHMQNKKQEARELQAKMNDAQQTELMAAAIEVSAKCASGEVLGPVKKP